MYMVHILLCGVEAGAACLTCCCVVRSICWGENNCKASSLMAKEDQAQGQESSQPGALFFVIFVRDAHAHLTVSTESIQCTSARGFGPLGGWGGVLQGPLWCTCCLREA